MRDWSSMRGLAQRLLEERTGQPLAAWNRRVKEAGHDTPRELYAWLKEEGVAGYPADLLAWERFGYPGFLVASAGELIDAQYQDRPRLRPILDRVLGVALGFAGVAVQARKTYVSLVTPKRTFARIRPTTKARLDVALRLGQPPGGRLKPSRIHESMPVQLELASEADVDAEARRLLRAAYEANA